MTLGSKVFTSNWPTLGRLDGAGFHRLAGNKVVEVDPGGEVFSDALPTQPHKRV